MTSDFHGSLINHMAQSNNSLLIVCVLSISCLVQSSRARPVEKVQDAVAKSATEVEYQRLDINPCVKTGDYVVDDKNALQALIRQHRSSTFSYFCKHFDKKSAKIDFSKYTLIGVRSETDLCQRFSVKIIKDNAAKRYRHILIANKPPRCRSMGLMSIWVLVPKLPFGFEVTFEKRIESGERVR